MQVFGGIASVMIAYFAYEIDIKVQNNALRMAQVDRSNAMVTGIFNDPNFQRLRTRVSKMESRYSKRIRKQQALKQQNPDRQVKSSKMILAEVNGNWVNDLTQEHLYLFVEHVNRADRCIKPLNPDSDDVTAHPICDRNTIYLMMGSTFFDLYAVMKPAIYCIDGLDRQAQSVANFMRDYHTTVNGLESGIGESFFKAPGVEVCETFHKHFKPDVLDGVARNAVVGQNGVQVSQGGKRTVEGARAFPD
ncbi:MAG: hypothetical protein AAF415_10535 [Pseudomonadota bacterium]